MSQLAELAIPFPSSMVHENPSGGGNYVKHGLYKQRLLLHLGAYSFEMVEIVRGDVAEIKPNPNGNSQRAKDGRPALTDAVCGVVMRLTATIDGERVVVEEGGDCEDPHNWPHDGARLKDAISDALKRCCPHIGLGLHLYCPGEYVLREKLRERQEAAEPADEDPPTIPMFDPDDPSGAPFDDAA